MILMILEHDDHYDTLFIDAKSPKKKASNAIIMIVIMMRTAMKVINLLSPHQVAIPFGPVKEFQPTHI
jgi:hypothetical protein